MKKVGLLVALVVAAGAGSLVLASPASARDGHTHDIRGVAIEYPRFPVAASGESGAPP